MLTRRGFLRNALVVGGLGSAGGIFVYQAASMLSSLGKTKRRALKVASTKDLGVVGKPASVLVRDGGATLLLGDRLLWMFGDTLVSNDTQIRSNTAALADPEQPLVTHDALDAHGRPYQFVPFTARSRQIFSCALARVLPVPGTSQSPPFVNCRHLQMASTMLVLSIPSWRSMGDVPFM